jgi:hypothetical protein
MWARQREVEQVQRRAEKLAEDEVLPPQRATWEEPLPAE